MGPGKMPWSVVHQYLYRLSAIEECEISEVREFSTHRARRFLRIMLHPQG